MACNTERTVFHASLNKQVPDKGDLQTKLDVLAQQPELAAMLDEQANNRRLEFAQVIASVRQLEHTVSKHCSGNDGRIIAIKPKYYDAYERAALAAFMRLQDSWPHALGWKEMAYSVERDGGPFVSSDSCHRSARLRE